MAAPKQSNERLFCWEQVMRTNPLFRVSQVFAPGGQAELLPLYALFATLEELCAQSPDEEVWRRKLEWWRSECLVHEPADSNHPILRELTRSGAAERLDRQLLAQLFDSAEVRLVGHSPVDDTEFESLCRLTGQTPCALERNLAAAGGQPRLPLRAARVGLAQLLRESVGQGGADRFWWLPLNHLARHGVSRSEVGRNPDTPSVQALFQGILREAHAWDAERQSAGEHPASASSVEPHLAVHSHLQQRALRRLERLRPSDYGGALRRVGLGELFAAWSAARRVSRP